MTDAVTSLQWERCRFLANTKMATVEGIHVALYHNPRILPTLYSVYIPDPHSAPWTFRSPYLAEAGAIRLVNLVLSQRKKEPQMQLNLSLDPKTPNQLPPGVADDVGKHDESDFNDDDSDDDALDPDDEDSMLRDVDDE